jgi:hypothetical protein
VRVVHRAVTHDVVRPVFYNTKQHDRFCAGGAVDLVFSVVAHEQAGSLRADGADILKLEQAIGIETPFTGREEVSAVPVVQVRAPLSALCRGHIATVGDIAF